MASKKSLDKNSRRREIFLSHSHQDAALAQVLNECLDKVFGVKAINFHATSIDNDIKPGEDFFATIRSRITTSDVILFLLTPNSLESLWVWFEMGVCWERYAKGNMGLVPMTLNVDHKKLPPHFQTIKYVDLAKPQDIKNFFKNLVSEFIQGDATKLDEVQLAQEMKNALTLPPQNLEINGSVNKQDLSHILTDLIRLEALNTSYLSAFNDIYSQQEIREMKKIASKKR